ncbi:unnamed protein product, partial [Symbiodinium microadriaticum]
MEEEAADIDGDALAARDCACVGEGFLDPLAPLCFLACGEDEEGFPVTVRCVVVGDVQGKLLICLPAAAWHRKVAKRTVPRGFLSKVIAAAVAAASVADRAVEIPGVEPHVLGEMSRLVDSRPLQRLRAEPSQNTAGRRPTPLKEPEAVDPVAAPAATSTSLQPARSLEPAEALAQAMVRCLDSLRSGSCKQSVLDRALDASGGGSLDGSLNSGRRNAAARKALRDSLTSAPQEISKMIEALMAEDLNASTPGAGSPVLSSTRAWLEHRSRIQAFPSMVHLTWAIAGALDCLRASKPEQ